MSKDQHSSPDDLAFRRMRNALCISLVAITISVLAATAIINYFFINHSIAGGGSPQVLHQWLLLQLALGAVALPVSVLLCFRAAGFAASPLRRNMEIIRKFTQDAGHELATPVSILKSRLQVMERELSDGGQGVQHLTVLTDATSRMASLIDDLRLLAKSENPNRFADLSLVKFDRMVQKCIDQMQPQFTGKQMTVASNLDSSSMVGDGDALERVVLNLLSNALKYGKHGGKVDVKVHNEQKHLVLVVADDGDGMPEDCLPLLFDRFYRAEASRSRAAGGSGLGLAIVKAIVDSHQGDVRVSSEVGRGTSFTLKFPKFPRVHPFALLSRKGGNIGG